MPVDVKTVNDNRPTSGERKQKSDELPMWHSIEHHS
jgi:hypothetical protein